MCGELVCNSFLGLRNALGYPLQRQPLWQWRRQSKSYFFWLVFMLPDMATMPCVTVLQDNQGAVQLAPNPTNNANSTQIDVRRHSLSELVAKGKICVTRRVRSEYQRADSLTKPLSTEAFQFHGNFRMNMSSFLG